MQRRAHIMFARAAQGDKKASAKSRVGTQRDGGVSERIVEVAVVERYRPGKAPKWVDEGAGSSTIDEFDGGGFSAPQAAATSSAGDGDSSSGDEVGRAISGAQKPARPPATRRIRWDFDWPMVVAFVKKVKMEFPPIPRIVGFHFDDVTMDGETVKSTCAADPEKQIAAFATAMDAGSLLSYLFSR